MKTNRIISFLMLHSLLGFTAFAAAPFDCGSTGAYGPMNITNDTTLLLPPDGVFHCTTIAVAQGATLRFNRNALNTPVYLLATENVKIDGTIDISANDRQGGPGGFDGGHPGSPYVGHEQGGDGYGPGGGTAGGITWGRFAGIYGNLLLVPLIGGSGSSPWNGSPWGYGWRSLGGGGAIMIAASTMITINGAVQARGGTWDCTSYPHLSGSGGAVRLVAPVVGGTGAVDVSSNCARENSNGRIRIDCHDNQAYRSLNLAGVASRGSRMIVFPAVIPALDIIEVGGQPIAEGTNSAVTIELAVGAPTSQTVRVQARNFTNDVPIRVVIMPENGPSGSFDAVILQASGNPPSTNVPVIIPAGSVCQIHAWTR
ncbi:MAG: hypothetical protein HZA90_15845 [Verrucomicrobia bacterium]|nr:hypothetical protein [Verrucomicrobiota bacterium]